MIFDLPDKPFFEETTSRLSSKNAKALKTAVKVLSGFLIAVSLCAFVILGIALNKNDTVLLETGRGILQAAGSCLFLLIGAGHWIAGRKVKAFGCWAVTLSLLLTIAKLDPVPGLVASGLGVIGIFIALFPRKKADKK